MTELKENEVVEGPLGTEAATGWLHNPVLCDKKYGGNIRLTLDMRPMAAAVKTAHFSIPTAEELCHEFKGSKKCLVLDKYHSFCQLMMDEATQRF